MRHFHCALVSLWLLTHATIFANSNTVGEQVDGPYVALFDVSRFGNPPHEVRLLRSDIEQERKQQIEACQKDEKHLRSQLDGARSGLRDLNASSPRDTRSMATARSSLHDQI